MKAISLTVVWRAAATFFRREPWLAEFASGLTAILWSWLTYVSPDDMDRWPSMSFLLRLGGDETWIAISSVLGIFQLSALLGDYRWLRWVGALAMCWFWSVLTLGVWFAVPWAPGIAVYAGWIAVNVFSILRLLRLH